MLTFIPLYFVVYSFGPVRAVVSTVVSTNHRPVFLSRDQRVTCLWRQWPADAAAKFFCQPVSTERKVPCGHQIPLRPIPSSSIWIKGHLERFAMTCDVTNSSWHSCWQQRERGQSLTFISYRVIRSGIFRQSFFSHHFFFVRVFFFLSG